MMTARMRLLLVLLLAVVTAIAALLYVVSYSDVAFQLLQVVMLLVGLMATTAVSLLHRLLNERSGAPLVQITFNLTETRAALKEVIDIDAVETRARLPNDRPWEPTTESLLVEDPALALAKLRLDIEQALRRLASSLGIRAEPMRLDFDQLLRTLLDKDRLPPQAFGAISGIVPVCHAALHGASIDGATVRSVLSIGEDVLTVLRNIERDSHAQAESQAVQEYPLFPDSPAPSAADAGAQPARSPRPLRDHL